MFDGSVKVIRCSNFEGPQKGSIRVRTYPSEALLSEDYISASDAT